MPTSLRARLAEGVWAVGTGHELRIGVLEGDIGNGWTASYGAVPRQALPQLVRHLNVGGSHIEPTLRVVVDSGWAILGLPDRGEVVLDDAGTARLQVLASHILRTPPSAGPEEASEPPVRVWESVDGLVVQAPPLAGSPLAAAQVVALRAGVVEAVVPTTAGPVRLSLPALPLLVAGAEAVRDGSDLLLRVPGLGEGGHLTLRTDASQAEQAAAEAQWLLGGFERPIDISG